MTQEGSSLQCGCRVERHGCGTVWKPHSSNIAGRLQDIECIDSLAEAIKKFNGGLVLVSHDFRLIDQVRFCPFKVKLLKAIVEVWCVIDVGKTIILCCGTT